MILRWTVWDRPHEDLPHVGTWRKRCTWCGHRVGSNVRQTREQPWRIPWEMIMRLRAMRRR